MTFIITKITNAVKGQLPCGAVFFVGYLFDGIRSNSGRGKHFSSVKTFPNSRALRSSISVIGIQKLPFIIKSLKARKLKSLKEKNKI